MAGSLILSGNQFYIAGYTRLYVPFSLSSLQRTFVNGILKDIVYMMCTVFCHYLLTQVRSENACAGVCVC